LNKNVVWLVRKLLDRDYWQMKAKE
jgi:hypothetical protein